jgi:hypothetical protein
LIRWIVSNSMEERFTVAAIGGVHGASREFFTRESE